MHNFSRLISLSVDYFKQVSIDILCVCVFQDEVDSQNPVLRDNHQLHEEVKGWLKDQKVQEIFMQGKLFTTLFISSSITM